MKPLFLSRLADDSGVISVVIAVAMVMLLGTAALALDIAHLLEVKNELQRVTDGAAMAGARGLWPDTLPQIGSSPTPDCATAYDRGMSIVTNASNKVDGAPLTTGAVTLEAGRWDYSAHVFTVGCVSNSNAVKVTARKEGVNMLFAGVLGRGPVTLTATATAVMDFAGGVGKGTLPIAINKRYVVPGQYLFINFNPDPMDNGGWFANPPDGANARTFRDYINYGTCPPLKVGDIISLQNGEDASVLQDLQAKLAEHGGQWDTFLPVVNTDTFNQSQPIAAFLPFRITEVKDTSSSKGVGGNVLGLAESASAQPGGQNCGLLAPPKAVN